MLWRRVEGVSGEWRGSGVLRLYRLLLQSRHKILSPSGKKPAPTSETEHWVQVKHGWCHWRSSNEMYFPPPKPAAKKKKGEGRLNFRGPTLKSAGLKLHLVKLWCDLTKMAQAGVSGRKWCDNTTQSVWLRVREQKRSFQSLILVLSKFSDTTIWLCAVMIRGFVFTAHLKESLSSYL